MIALTAPIYIILAMGSLWLNWYAFRSSAAMAGHQRHRWLQMAAIWSAIIVALALIIRFFTG